MTNQLSPVRVDEWRALVRTNAPGAHGLVVAPILADLAEPATGTIRLDDKAVRRLVLGAHVHPVGLRRTLAKFIAAGLLATVPSSGDWGTYRLAMPGVPRNRGHFPTVCRPRPHRDHR